MSGDAAVPAPEVALGAAPLSARPVGAARRFTTLKLAASGPLSASPLRTPCP